MENSTLGKLSIELRLEIYMRALTFDSLHYLPSDNTPCFYYFPDNPDDECGTWWVADQGKSLPLRDGLALTLACKQVRSESVGLVLEANAPKLNSATVKPRLLGDCALGLPDDESDFSSLHNNFEFRDACSDVLIALLSIPSVFHPRKANFCLPFELRNTRRYHESTYIHKDPLVRSALKRIIEGFRQCTFTFALHIGECKQLKSGSSDLQHGPIVYLKAGDHEAGLKSISQAFARRMDMFSRDHHEGHYCDLDSWWVMGENRESNLLRSSILDGEFMVRQFNGLLAELKAREREISPSQALDESWLAGEREHQTQMWCKRFNAVLWRDQTDRYGWEDRPPFVIHP